MNPSGRPRTVIVFQWRLNPGFKVDLNSILDRLPSFLEAPKPQPEPKPSQPPVATPDHAEPHPPTDGVITVIVRNQMGSEIPFKVKRSTRISKIRWALAMKWNFELSTMRLMYESIVHRTTRLEATDSVGDLNMQDGDRIDVFLEQVGD